MEKGKGKGGQQAEGREEWWEGKGASWLCGMDAPVIRISNKKPKIFWPLNNNNNNLIYIAPACRMTSEAQQGAGIRWRGIGGKARRG